MCSVGTISVNAPASVAHTSDLLTDQKSLLNPRLMNHSLSTSWTMYKGFTSGAGSLHYATEKQLKIADTQDPKYPQRLRSMGHSENSPETRISRDTGVPAWKK